MPSGVAPGRSGRKPQTTEIVVVVLILAALGVAGFLLFRPGVPAPLAIPANGSGVTANESGVPANASAVDVTIAVLVGENNGPGTKCGFENFGTLYMNLPGSDIRVSDEAGKLIGVGNVPSEGIVIGNGSDDSCKFDFQIPLQGDAAIYDFDFGEFGKVTKTRQEMESSGWKLVLG